MDEDTTRFVRDHLDSRTKLDVALFLHQNRFALESAAGLARRIGRSVEDILPDLQELAAARVVSVRSEAGSPEQRLYAYTEDGLVAKQMQGVADAYDGPSRAALYAGVLEAEGRRSNLRLRELFQLDSLKTQFLSLISHELRTPLTAIKGYVELLQANPDLDGEQRDFFLSTVASECDRLTTTVNNLLLAAEIERGDGWECACRPVALQPIVGRLVGEVARREPARSFRVDSFPGEPLVLADEVGVELVLRNLLDNAAKFSLEGSTVHVWAETAGGDVLLNIGDEGIGICADRLRTIFERFYQAEYYRTRRANGAGLGLYLARKVMERMSGRISVSSELGRGSIFTCAFVLATEEGEGRRVEAAMPGVSAKVGGVER